MMTKRDFTLIASALRNHFKETQTPLAVQTPIVMAVASACQDANANFSTSKFVLAATAV